MLSRFPYEISLCDTRSTGRRHPAGAPAARPAATEVGEPRQVRKEAAAAAHLRVPAVHLAAGGPAGAKALNGGGAAGGGRPHSRKKCTPWGTPAAGKRGASEVKRSRAGSPHGEPRTEPPLRGDAAGKGVTDAPRGA